MRTEQEMMSLILSIAEQDERIRIVTLEGSRTNINIPKDEFQDYEDMELFPPEEKGYSYLMLFDDYNKIDLTLLTLEDLDDYLNSDRLKEVLFDKDGRINKEIVRQILITI